MKKFVVGVICFFCTSVLIAGCPKAAGTNTPQFCATFKTAAQCHCTASGLPQALCTNVRLLYQRLIITFGTIEKTCAFQRDTTKENCIESWKCYLNGGKNMAGQLCNGTGRSCP
jgi:hypothetical protein